MTDEEFSRRACELLQRELGPDGIGRFLRLGRPGGGRCARDPEKWLNGLSLDDVLKLISASRQRKN